MMQPKVQDTDRGKRVVFYLEWWLRGRLRESGQSWDIFYDAVAEDIFQARQFVSTQRANLTTSSSPVSHAFAAAEAALTAAEAGLASANALLRLDVPSTSLAAKTPPTVIYIPNVRKATEKVARAREEVVNGRNLRFSEVYRNPSHFFAAKASLDVVKSSLDAAKAALETANTALNDSSISTESR
jgi:multidrug efflux pump subunit AcrA (membrane-fusion protein)